VVNKMILQNVLHRPVRTIVSVLAVAIEVGMVLLVVGMTTGLLSDSNRRVQGVGADVLVQPPGASFLFSFSSAPMTLKIGDVVREVPHVLAVSPVFFHVDLSGGVNVIYGIDMPSFDRVTNGFVYHAGGPLAGPDDVLVDDWFARAHHLSVGSKIELLKHEFKVAGIVEHGKGARVFLPLETLQELSGAPGRASIFFVKCTDPGYTDDVVASIRKLLPAYQILTIQEYLSLMTSSNLPAFDAFVRTMIGVAVGIGFLVIFLSMYTTITERTREIGILKSLGASKRYIIEVILREAGLLSILGIGAGYAGTLIAQRVIRSTFPTLPIEIGVVWELRAAILAVAGSLLGAFYPALRAAQLDPVDALAYE
jgi:putative ABC transport system permease protein